MHSKCLMVKFGATMKLWLLLLLLTFALNCLAQDKVVTGIVYEKNNQERVASVNIHNVTTGFSRFNNLKGEFKITVREGDVLIFTKPEFHPDTVTVKGDAQILVYMARIAIQLKEVKITDTALNAEKRLAATKQDFTKIYGSSANPDFLSTSSGGAGLSIDALYNAISRSGRNAEHLRETIENDYRQNVIDFRFNRTYVGNITGLKDDKLTSFMFRYRPGYYTTTTATDYEFIAMIKANLRRYLRNQHIYSLPNLPKVNAAVKLGDK